ncbi:related to polyketide synthase [Cephalotrichum gorgonifer]|uniref:Related to polyketide synthase n=1 Tax=Cephalotrichum gorgonifer TaxID=2041049 RepID=A0AAE8SWJ7_9PEZI|nr:related to polyketide synthase [Cephalotrichum gorgonifer]
MEDIAIIGLACRFPGDATSPENLWEEVLAKGKSTWTEFPADRFNLDGFHHPDNKRQGSLAVRGAHFLKSDVGLFDCSFFDMNPNDATAADPQQRTLMEVSFEALQNAGIKLEAMAGTNTGVYVASFVKDYEQITLQDSDFIPQYAATGNATSLLANRLSYFYNVSGPSMTVDTACSGSLVAVHLAVQGLRTQETSMAIVGGSNLILSPNTMIPMDTMGLLSPDGKCFTFDSRANGYGRGEGAGIVILKRISDAINANDNIRAVIRGSRVNHDGRTPGITMPGKDSQAQNIREVYKMAGLDFNQTGYVECHGTGTKAGDPVELTAISESICSHRSANSPLVVGSIKTNIGHLEGAAGIAGLIKSILVLEKGVIPPNINFEKPNPAIHFEEWKVKVPLELTPWPIEGLRRVSINSFGFGGTNAHVILDEAGWYLAERGLRANHCSAPYAGGYHGSSESPIGAATPISTFSGTSFQESPIWDTKSSQLLHAKARRGPGSLRISNSPGLLKSDATALSAITLQRSETASSRGADSVYFSESFSLSPAVQPTTPGSSSPGGTGGMLVFPFSCRNKAGFSVFIEETISYLQDKRWESPGFLQDYAYSLAARSSAFKWRTYLIDDSVGGLIQQLRNTTVDKLVQSSPKSADICFVFGGQGSAWAEMGRDLLPFKTFHESLVQATMFMQTNLQSSFNLMDELLKPSAESRITSPDISQSVTTAFQVALVDLLRSFGIVPQYVVGHSSGEIAAAYAASEMTRHQAWALAYYRGFHVIQLSAKHPHIEGRMIVVGMSAEDAEKYVEISKSVEVACINSPTLVTLSGNRDGIDLIAADLAEKKIFHRTLDIPVAYHSRHMDLIAEDYKASIGEFAHGAPSNGTIMLSSLYGGLADTSKLDAEYWANNLTGRVQFVKALRAFDTVNSGKRPKIFIEVGPSNAMRRPTLELVGPLYDSSSVPVYMSVLKTGARGIDVLLDTLGSCWARGVPVDFQEVASKEMGLSWIDNPRYLTDIPRQRWNHSRRYWHESHLAASHRFRSAGRKDLVGARSPDSSEFRSTWKHFLRLSENPWIKDHQIHKAILYPAAGMIVMALEAFVQVAPERENIAGFYLTGFTIERPMVVPDGDHGLEVSMTLANLRLDDFEHSFDIYSKTLNGQWQKNASGRIRLRNKSSRSDFEFSRYRSQWTSLEGGCPDIVTPSQLYASLESKGLGYGPMFRNITSASVKPGDAVDSRACITTVKTPDTKAKMPREFEYLHLIHPTTLDSMIQTLFLVNPTSMVPTGIDKIWISADLVGKAGLEFRGYSTGTEEGISGAVGTIAMTTGGWEVPSVVLDEARFTKLTPLPVPEGGFIANHRNLTSEIVWKEDITAAKSDQFEEFLLLLAHKYPGLSILQIGLSASVSERILNILHPRVKERCHLSRFTISSGDRGPGIVAKINESFKDSPVLKCVEERKYDHNMAVESPRYHLIVAAFESAGTQEESWFGKLLPDGFLLRLVDEDSPSTLDAGLNHDRPKAPTRASEAEQSTETIYWSPPGLQFELYRNKEEPEWQNCHSVALLIPDKQSSLASRTTEESGQEAASSTSIDGVPCVSFLSAEEGGDFIFNWDKAGFEAFKYLVKKTKSVLWLTRNVYLTPENPHASLFVGLARTLISEDSQRNIVTLDISGKASRASWTGLCLDVFGRSFLAEKVLRPREAEYCVNGERLLIPRLQLLYTLNAIIEGADSDESQEIPFAEDDTGILRLVLRKSGITDGSRVWEKVARYENDLAPRQVEIQFVSAPLLGQDYETALGRTTLTSLGLDICGRIKAVGRDVRDLKAGDLVVGVNLEGAFQNTMRLDRGLVAKVPENDPRLGSKFILSCYLPAWYAIHPIMQHTPQRDIFSGKRRSILIHHAASAHGQAAIILAQASGLDIYATVCHDDTKTALRELGVQDDHIIPFRSFSCWDGKVDITYDPTGTLFSQSSLRTTHCYSSLKSHSRPGGSGSSDRSSPAGGTHLVRHIDLRSMLADEGARASIHEIVSQIQFTASRGLIAIGSMQSVETRDLAHMSSALSYMADGCPKDRILSIEVGHDTRVPVMLHKQLTSLSAHISPSGAYVLVGAFGGLGEMIADLLVRNGAKTLVFLSRRGADSPKARAFCQKLKKGGVKIVTYAVDVTNLPALKSVWESVVRQVKVLGVVQCAAVLKDAVFENIDHADWVASTRPKTHGSWNIFSVLRDSYSSFLGCFRQKPWILFLSSASGVIGNRGQASYAAGNVFQDALAHHAKHRGFHAVSLDFGPVLGAGILERDESILEKLRASGFFGIRPEDFLTVMQSAICGEVTTGTALPTQVVVGVGTGGRVHQNRDSDPYWTRTALYSVLARIDLPPGDLSDLGGGNPHLGAPEAAGGGGGGTAEGLAQGLAAVLAKSMNMNGADVDLHKSMESFGVDSLVATAVRRWISTETGVMVSMFDLMGDKSIDALATMVVEKMGGR